MNKLVATIALSIIAIASNACVVEGRVHGQPYFARGGYDPSAVIDTGWQTAKVEPHVAIGPQPTGTDASGCAYVVMPGNRKFVTRDQAVSWMTWRTGFTRYYIEEHCPN
jgi:hypothetical protein